MYTKRHKWFRSQRGVWHLFRDHWRDELNAKCGVYVLNVPFKTEFFEGLIPWGDMCSRCSAKSDERG